MDVTGPAGAQGLPGTNGTNGAVGAVGATGQNGLNALIKTTSEVAGANCANGGNKIETGVDANGNGVLDAGEVNASQTQYVCNGNSGNGSLSNGTNQGEMLYWNGTSWVNVPPGQTGQYLTFCYNAPQWGPCLAQITTTPVSNITGFNATSGGQISSDGGSTITAMGICWDVNPSPDLNDNFTTDGIGIGTFTSNLINLIPNTIYYVRAYATNAGGTIYGNEITFTSGADLPTVVTGASSNISYNSAIVSGEVTSDGGASVTQRGICYSTNPNPTISNSNVDSGSGVGSFSSSLTGLTSNTIYYARAFATNSSGTSYGNEISISTLSPPQPLQCSGYNCQSGGLLTTSPSINAQGFIEVSTGQNISINMTHCFSGFSPSQYCQCASFTNPLNTTVVSSTCSPNDLSGYIAENISFSNPGTYVVNIQSGRCSNMKYCSLTIVVN